MNAIIVLVACLVVTTMSSTVTKEEIQMSENRKVEYSESAKAQLRDAANAMIETLCMSEHVDPDILKTICLKALYKKLGRSNYPKISTYGQTDPDNCIDCELTDPICWDNCPQ